MNRPWWLLIEDDQVDTMSVERSLRAVGSDIDLALVPNGFEPVEHLLASMRERHGVPPQLILLDINLPLANGHEVLSALKSAPEARRVPVVMLTTSDHDRDIREAYERGAAGYFVKPLEFSSFAESIRVLAGYWALSRFPPVGANGALPR